MDITDADLLIETLSRDMVSLDVVRSVLDKLSTAVAKVDHLWVQPDGAEQERLLKFSQLVEALRKDLISFQGHLSLAIGSTEVWRMFKESKERSGQGKETVNTESPFLKFSGRTRKMTENHGFGTYLKVGGQILWCVIVTILVGVLWRTGNTSLTAPQQWKGESFPSPHLRWWSEEGVDWTDVGGERRAIEDGEPLKHRRALLEGSFRGPSFGEGISFHSSQRTWLSEYLVGFMILESFCVFLLTLYPSLAPFRRRILGGGLISYSVICLFSNFVPFLKEWSEPSFPVSLDGLETKLPDFEQVESERRETYQLFREKNWEEMDPFYYQAIEGPLSFPLEIIQEKIDEFSSEFNIYCFVGYRRTVQSISEPGSPMLYELALGVSAGSQKGIFTNVVPISAPLSSSETLKELPEMNVEALIKEILSEDPLYLKSKHMFRPMVTMNFLRLISLSVDGFQGLAGPPRFFVENATIVAFTAKRDRPVTDRFFSIPQFWLILLLVICVGLLCFFWDLWKYRQQLVASHVLIIGLWGNLIFFVGSRWILHTLTLMMTLPLITIVVLYVKEYFLLKRGVSWVFTMSGNIPADCESLLRGQPDYNRLIARALGLTPQSLCLHHVECETNNPLVHSDKFIAADLEHAKRMEERGLSLPTRRIGAISESFELKFRHWGWKSSWTDKDGALLFPLKHSGELVKVTQCIFGQNLGVAWGNAVAIPIQIDLFSKELCIGEAPTVVTTVISPQFSMNFYLETGRFSRKLVVFMCFLALKSSAGVIRRARYQHILKHHLSRIPEDSDEARIITDFFEGTLDVKDLQLRITQLVWRQLSFLKRVKLIQRRVMSGKPLFPVEELLAELPPPKSLARVKKESRERTCEGVAVEERRSIFPLVRRNLPGLLTWGVGIFFLVNILALLTGYTLSLPFIHSGFAQMHHDLPRITNRIAAFAPVHPEYKFSHAIYNAPKVSVLSWSALHAFKLTTLPILWIVEKPLIVMGLLFSGLDFLWKGDKPFYIPALFWSVENENYLSLPTAVNGGAISMGVTWDWQGN